MKSYFSHRYDKIDQEELMELWCPTWNIIMWFKLHRRLHIQYDYFCFNFFVI